MNFADGSQRRVATKMRVRARTAALAAMFLMAMATFVWSWKAVAKRMMAQGSLVDATSTIVPHRELLSKESRELLEDNFFVFETALGWCNSNQKTKYDGTEIRTIPDVQDVGMCCKACQESHLAADPPLSCNAWTWCGDQEACGSDYLRCTLKHIADMNRPATAFGSDVGWSSGVVNHAEESSSKADGRKKSEDTGTKYHVLLTAAGFGQQWLARIAYYHYCKIKEENPNSDMGGFTRVLHTGEPDVWMDVIPTFVALALPPGVDKGYIVLNRPYGVLQWIEQEMHKIPEKYVLISEPDHLFIRPLPNFMVNEKPATYPFWYIQPTDHRELIRKIVGSIPDKDFEHIHKIGSSPLILTKGDLAKIVPTWLNVSVVLKNNPESDQTFGWVQEMYAWSIASFLEGIHDFILVKDMILHPPFDSNPGNSPIIHLTYGMTFAKNGQFVRNDKAPWVFNKRDYSRLPPPRNLTPPPKGTTNKVVIKVIELINEATANIPGWDEYARDAVDHCCRFDASAQ